MKEEEGGSKNLFNCIRSLFTSKLISWFLAFTFAAAAAATAAAAAAAATAATALALDVPFSGNKFA